MKQCQLHSHFTLDIKQIAYENLEKQCNLASKFWKEKHSNLEYTKLHVLRVTFFSFFKKIIHSVDSYPTGAIFNFYWEKNTACKVVI